MTFLHFYLVSLTAMFIAAILLLERLRKKHIALLAEADNLRKCVRWYADQNHMNLPDWEAPESGAEGCWLCPPEPVEDQPWMVEDGGVARSVLKGLTMHPHGTDDDLIVGLPRAFPAVLVEGGER